MPKVAFYTRISTDEDHQKYSLDAQKDRLEAYCKSQYGDEWSLFKAYRDTESGTHMNRPGLEEMLYDALKKQFDTLLVFRVDRLSRKVRELALMVDELTKNGVTLKSITEPFDTANAAGKMMLQMLGVFAEFEHATIVERTKVGMEKKAKGGAWVGGVVPFGYLLDPEKGLVVKEDEALLVRKMFKLYAFGREGSQAITLKLNEEGHRKRSGRRWNNYAILQILRNPIYVGKLRWREAIYEGKHEAIVSELLFEKAGSVLKERSEETNGRRWHNGDERLLAGVIKCAKCRAAMVGISTQHGGQKFPYYVCDRRRKTHECGQDYVRADLLETAIMQDVKDIFRDEQFMARVWEEANRRLGAERPEIEKEIDSVDTEVQQTRKTINRYLAAFENETLTPELCGEKVRELKERQRALEHQRQELEARRESVDLQPLDKQMLAKLMDDFERVMAEGTNPQKKHLLQHVVKKVLIHDRNTIEVWYGLPNSQYVCTLDGLAPRARFELAT